ncbi:MAG: type VI secretion system baseplate subunit TssF, partial [Pseudomonadota bacterium]
MDRTFFGYYEAELDHLRNVAMEFAALNQPVANALLLQSAKDPCPDPYVERLLEGVAFLAARTRMKLDYEGSRHVRALLEALYPDLAAPGPAVGMVQLKPGDNVATMRDGHLVARAAPLSATSSDLIATRAIYLTAQPVHLWPVRVAEAEYLGDPGAIGALGGTGRLPAGTEAGIRVVIERTGEGAMSDLTLDALDLYLGNDTLGRDLTDALLGWGRTAFARPAEKDATFRPIGAPGSVGFGDDEAMLPRVRGSFEGYRLLREYFLLPERFNYLRLTGLRPIVSAATGRSVEVVIPFARERRGLIGLKAANFEPFVTPIVNLYERECNLVDVDPRRSSQIVHVNATRPNDFEIYRLISVTDADREGEAARLHDLYALDRRGEQNFVYSTDRRPRRPNHDEVVKGQMRTPEYPGDDFFISVARPPGAKGTQAVRRLNIRALVTNRDLPIANSAPRLSFDRGDPVGAVILRRPLTPPRKSLAAGLPKAARDARDADDITWRWIAQLSLSQVSMAEDGTAPLR